MTGRIAANDVTDMVAAEEERMKEREAAIKEQEAHEAKKGRKIKKHEAAEKVDAEHAKDKKVQAP